MNIIDSFILSIVLAKNKHAKPITSNNTKNNNKYSL